MKIRYALLSCNSEMGYLGWWPAVARAWRRLGITPVLFFIRDSDTVKPPPADGIVHELELLDDVAVSVQYTWARFWGASLYPDDVVIIADMDMLPLSADYFVGQLEHIPEDEWVHLHALYYNHRPDCMRRAGAAGKGIPAPSDLAPADVDRLLAFYHVARGSLMKEVLALSDDWGRSAREVQPWYTMEVLVGALWHGEEIYTTAKIKGYRKQSVFRLLVAQKRCPRHDLPRRHGLLWCWRWRQWAAAERFISKDFQLTHDPSRLRSGYYLGVHLPLPCTPEHLARVDLLIKGESCPPMDEPVDKWKKHLLALRIAEGDFVRHGAFLADMKSAFRLLTLYLQKNRSPQDAAWSRYVRKRAGEMVRSGARALPAFFRR